MAARKQHPDIGMQLPYLKEKHSSCGRCCRGKWENPISDRVHDIGSMSTLSRWHLLLVTLWIFLEGIFKRLIEGVKRQQLRSTVFPYLHSKIPNLNLVATRDSWKKPHVIPSLKVLFTLSDPWHSSSAPSHRQSTFELCDFYLCPLVEHIRIKTL